MTNFLLIRHGETAWNRELRFQGQLDVPLNETGFLQAQRLRIRLEKLLHEWHHAQQIPTRLISSDLMRAQQTAEPLAELLNLECLLEAGLREQCFGVFEGLRASDIQEKEPEAWQQWIQFNPHYAMRGAESTHVFYERIMDTLNFLATKFTNENLVVVTHGGVLDMIWRNARSLPLSGPRQCDIPNAGLNQVTWMNKNLEVKIWADTSHLEGLPAQPVYRQRATQQPG